MLKRRDRYRHRRHAHRGCMIESLEERQLLSVIHENMGIPFTANLGTFAAPAGTAGLQASINWGDGTTSLGTFVPSAGKFVVDGTHTYKSVSTFPVVVTVSKAGLVLLPRLHDNLVVNRGNVSLRGTYKGVATPIVGNTLAGITYSIPGSGNLTPMGAVTGKGTLSIPGAHSMNANAVGILVLTTVSTSPTATGSVTLRLKGPKQNGGATPRTLSYTITGGSGNYTGATGSGTIQLTIQGRAFQAVFVPLTRIA